MKVQNYSPQLFRRPSTAVIGAVLLLLVFVSSLAIKSQAQTKPPYDKATLIKGLRLNAVDRQTSLQALAQAIAQRGVDFQMSARDEAELRTAGASNDVIEAIRMNYRHVRKPLPKGTGSLTINSPLADCKVFINGQLRGTTSESGVFRLPPLKAGQYKVALRKEKYEEEERSILITAGTDRVESFVLTPLKGQLTVNTTLAGVEIRLNGTEYPEGVKELSIPTGTYEVRVSKPGFRPFTKSIRLDPRASVKVDAFLEPVPLDELLTQAKQNYENKVYAASIALTRAVLAREPEQPKALALLASSLYMQSDYDEAINYFTKAISVGEKIRMPVLHRHGGAWDGKSLCSGHLIFERNSIEFFSVDFPDEGFTVPYSKISEMRIEDEIRLTIKARITKKNRKESNQEYNFYSTDAVATGRLITCPQCLPRMRLVLQILRQVRTGS